MQSSPRSPLFVCVTCLALGSLGCSASHAPPTILELDAPEYVVVDEPFGVFAATSDAGKATLEWSLMEDGQEVAKATGDTSELVVKRPGPHTILQKARGVDGQVARTDRQVIAETSAERDRRLTSLLIGDWRGQQDNLLILMRFQTGSKMSFVGQDAKGGAADAVLTMANSDMGPIVGEWWIQDGVLNYRVTGVEGKVWNLWVRFTDALTGGDFGKLERSALRFKDSSTVEINGIAADSKKTVFHKIDPVQ